MKKNGEYVGVDEKYMPKDEENKVNNDKKNDTNKGLKIAKGIGIGYLIFAGIMIFLVIFVFVFVFNYFYRIHRQDNGIDSNIINQSVKFIGDEVNKQIVDNFNSDLETYSGTNNGLMVSMLLDKVVTIIKKDSTHPITVTYGEIITSKPDEIVALKKQFDTRSQYEVSFDYDSNGYIYKITIANY